MNDYFARISKNATKLAWRRPQKRTYSVHRQGNQARQTRAGGPDKMIAKGTTVTLKTTNGGELTARLLLNYRPTYDICLEGPHGSFIHIINTRIKEVVAH